MHNHSGNVSSPNVPAEPTTVVKEDSLSSSGSALLKGMAEAARDAGETLMRHLREGVSVYEKENHELVTSADLASQKLLRERLCRLRPEAAFLGEEDWDGTIPDPPLWVVDPLDGTNNYAHGFPVFCVSVALCDREGPVAGVIYDPTRDELFSAIHGGGSLMDGRPVSASQVSGLGSALICTGFPYHRSKGDPGLELTPLVHFLGRAQGIRRAGSAALDLAYVACGRADGFYEQHLKPWDMAAGALLVTEAGGRTGAFEGGKWRLGSGGIVASGPSLFDAMRAGASVRESSGPLIGSGD